MVELLSSGSGSNISTVNTTHIPYNLYNTPLDASLRYLYPYSHSMFLPNGSAIFAQALEPLQLLPLKTSQAHHTLCEIIPTTGV